MEVQYAPHQIRPAKRVVFMSPRRIQRPRVVQSVVLFKTTIRKDYAREGFPARSLIIYGAGTMRKKREFGCFHLSTC